MTPCKRINTLASFWDARANLRRAVALTAGSALFACSACDGFKTVQRRDVDPADFSQWTLDETSAMSKKSPFLKAHMRNGDLFVLENWRGGADGTVTGSGRRYNAARTVIGVGSFAIPIDSVAVFETNQVKTSGATAALTAFAVVTVGIAIACAINPKACFGSCPTFFVDGNEHPLAEGFSASIAPSLEATDVDALAVRARGRFELVMKNEAYETHVVRHLDLLAVPHVAGARTVQALDGSFYRIGTVTPPITAAAADGDASLLLRARDGKERFSLADSSNLAAREIVELSFGRMGAGQHGIVLASRQSLLSTYLLYQAYAYMGTQAGHWMAEIERGRLNQVGDALVDLLGGISLSIETAPGEWTTVGEVTEFGPIAIDEHLVVFEAPPSWTGRARLSMTKGAWRVDEVALASSMETVEPVRLSPSAVLNDGTRDDTARARLVDPAQSLITLPGDSYTLVYEIPCDGALYDVFLESRGYYLEWIRDAWIEEENPALLAELFLAPEQALVRLAPEYKRVEAGMEQTFWSSRYAKP